jgi:hypothetical protein
MDDINLNVGRDPAPIAQQEVIPPVKVPLEGVDFLLDAIGFHNPAECLRIMQAGLADYKDFHYLVNKDIQDMAEDFSMRTVAQGCITFNLGCIKKLSGVMHWVQDCFHTWQEVEHFQQQIIGAYGLMLRTRLCMDTSFH